MGGWPPTQEEVKKWPGWEVKASNRFRPQPPQLYQSQCQAQNHQSVRLADIVIKDQFGNSLLTDIKSDKIRFFCHIKAAQVLVAECSLMRKVWSRIKAGLMVDHPVVIALQCSVTLAP